MLSPAEMLAAQKKLNPQPYGKLVRRYKCVWVCKIKDMRNALGLSLRDIEQATGINNVTLSFIERGAEPTLSNAYRLAEFFGKPLNEIWPEKIKEE